MDYEKEYKDALARAKEIQKVDFVDSPHKAIAEYIFPVLKNEDERIKKWLYNIIKNGSYLGEIPFEKNRVLAWIDKQGEQKPTNEPKFKVGDIIKPKDGGHEPWQVMQVDALNRKYRFKDGYVVHFSQESDYEIVEPKFKVEKDKWYVCISQFCNCIEGRVYKATSDSRIIDDLGTEYDIHSDAYKYFRLWTIDDAKEGDVLVASDGTLFILAKKLGDAVTDHASLSKETKGLIISAGNFRYEVANVCRPATKEEIAIMQNKLDESGYYWDGKAKELKKVEQKPTKNSDKIKDLLKGLLDRIDYAYLSPQGDYNDLSHVVADEVKYIKEQLKTL